jgi:hypothetical protein
MPTSSRPKVCGFDTTGVRLFSGTCANTILYFLIINYI